MSKEGNLKNSGTSDKAWSKRHLFQYSWQDTTVETCDTWFQ